MGINYLQQTKGGWIKNEIYYCINSDDVEAVICPLIKKLTSTRNMYMFSEFPFKKSAEL